MRRSPTGPPAWRTAVHNTDFGALHETFLVTAVTTVLVIRTQLWLTNYPQLGGHGLHIAHLLWGGLFMVVALGMLLTYVGRGVRRPAAIVGGVGFGFFIDELGKFVTSDNNYFYKPAAALIYLIFVGLFLTSRWMQRRAEPTAREELSNAIDLIGEAARHDLDERDRARAREMLERADPADPLVPELRALLERVSAIPTAPPPWYARWGARVRAAYLSLVRRPRFAAAIGWVFAVWAALSCLAVFELVLSVGLDLGGARRGFASDRIGDLGVIEMASLASSVLSAAFVVVGIGRLRRGDRAGALREFDRALLVAIFVTEVFAFVESQFGAVFGLAVDLLLWITVRCLIDAERHAHAGAGRDAAGTLPAPPRPAGATVATAG
jgi:hypothetical protein